MAFFGAGLKKKSTFVAYKPTKNNIDMRKILMLTAIFACVFAFASCKDEEDKDELKSVQYTIEAWPDEDFTGIYIHELNEKGDKLKTNTLYSLKRKETKTYHSERGCVKVSIYAKSSSVGYFTQEEDFLNDKENISLGFGISPISEDEYNFYTN